MTELPSFIDRDLYPFAPRRFETAEGAMSYLDEGRGAPVLLVHGTPTWSFEWRRVVTALAGKHRVIAPDHLGYGLSDKPEGAPYTPSDHARRLIALVDVLDLRELTLVVHDFGVPIGLPVALERPDRVTRIVVLNGWMWSHEGEASVARIDRLVRSRFGRWLYLDYDVSPRVLLPGALGDRRRLTRELHHHYLSPFARRQDRSALLAMAEALYGGNAHYQRLWSAREQLRGKLTDIVWGSADPAFGASYLSRWREAFPAAKVTELPGIGHFLAEEAPEAVVAAIDPSVRLPVTPIPPRPLAWAWGAAAALTTAAGVTAWLLW